MSDLPYGYVVTINQDGAVNPSSPPQNQWQMKYEEYSFYVDLFGETSESYTVKESDQGSKIRLKQSFGSEELGTTNLYSNALQINNVTPPGGGSIGDSEDITDNIGHRIRCITTTQDKFIVSNNINIDPKYKGTDKSDTGLVWDEQCTFDPAFAEIRLDNTWSMSLVNNGLDDVFLDSYFSLESICFESGPEPTIFSRGAGGNDFYTYTDGRCPFTFRWRNNEWMRRVRLHDDLHPGKRQYILFSKEDFNNPDLVLSYKDWPDEIVELFQQGSIESYVTFGWWHPTEDYGFLSVQVREDKNNRQFTQWLWRIDGDMLDINNWTFSANERGLNGEIRTCPVGSMRFIDNTWYWCLGLQGGAPMNDSSETVINWQSSDGGASWQRWEPTTRKTGLPINHRKGGVADIMKIGNSYLMVSSRDATHPEIFDGNQDGLLFISNNVDGPYKEVSFGDLGDSWTAYTLRQVKMWANKGNVLITSTGNDHWRFIVT